MEGGNKRRAATGRIALPAGHVFKKGRPATRATAELCARSPPSSLELKGILFLCPGRLPPRGRSEGVRLVVWGARGFSAAIPHILPFPRRRRASLSSAQPGLRSEWSCRSSSHNLPCRVYLSPRPSFVSPTTICLPSPLYSDTSLAIENGNVQTPRIYFLALVQSWWDPGLSLLAKTHGYERLPRHKA